MDMHQISSDILPLAVWHKLLCSKYSGEIKTDTTLLLTLWDNTPESYYLCSIKLFQLLKSNMRPDLRANLNQGYRPNQGSLTGQNIISPHYNISGHGNSSFSTLLVSQRSSPFLKPWFSIGRVITIKTATDHENTLKCDSSVDTHTIPRDLQAPDLNLTAP